MADRLRRFAQASSPVIRALERPLQVADGDDARDRLLPRDAQALSLERGAQRTGGESPPGGEAGERDGAGDEPREQRLAMAERRRDELPAGPQHPPQRGDGRGEVGDEVEDVRGHHGVEANRLELERVEIGLAHSTCVSPAAATRPRSSLTMEAE